MFLAILTSAQSLSGRLCLWLLLLQPIGLILIFFGHDSTVDIGGALMFVGLPFLILWAILLLILSAVRGVDLLSTEPAAGEVISVKRTGVFINNVPQLAVKMRVNGRNLITECRVLDFVGPAVGSVYNIKISRLNPAVAKIV